MNMKYVVAIIRSGDLEPLGRTLRTSINVRGLTTTKVTGFGEYANFFANDHLSERTKIEIFVEESKVAEVTEAIMSYAYTGTPGDGVVAVIPVDAFFHVRARSDGSTD
jgi:nitrogen regulatory protein PII